MKNVNNVIALRKMIIKGNSVGIKICASYDPGKISFRYLFLVKNIRHQMEENKQYSLLEVLSSKYPVTSMSGGPLDTKLS
jgi:hypothetical protein